MRGEGHRETSGWTIFAEEQSRDGLATGLAGVGHIQHRCGLLAVAGEVKGASGNGHEDDLGAPRIERIQFGTLIFGKREVTPVATEVSCSRAFFAFMVPIETAEIEDDFGMTSQGVRAFVFLLASVVDGGSRQEFAGEGLQRGVELCGESVVVPPECGEFGGIRSCDGDAGEFAGVQRQEVSWVGEQHGGVERRLKREAAIPTEDAPKMNDREQAILRLIAEGRTNVQIADEICLSPETVKWYRKRLLEKFDAANSAELISKAKGCGLV